MNLIEAEYILNRVRICNNCFEKNYITLFGGCDKCTIRPTEGERYEALEVSMRSLPGFEMTDEVENAFKTLRSMAKKKVGEKEEKDKRLEGIDG